MPRYIDADKYKKDLIHLGFLPALVVDVLDKQPTADVVPRSEVESLKEDKALLIALKEQLLEDHKYEVEKAEQEVAREVFEEIKKTIMNTNWTSQNYKEWYFGELKKKYIGEGNEQSKG